MCDTLIATSSVTATGIGLFAKNSDRPPNEAQHLVQVPAKDHTAGEKLTCTHIAIPQVPHTHVVLLSQPFWMWGAEMGVNEHGLAIGNEAVYSKIPANKEPALLGMDLLRLGLERAVTPREAVDVITSLLEEYGQGGNCTHQGHMYYHNSFIIANHEDAWVLETVDKQWAAKQITSSYSISNALTLTTEWDLSSQGLEAHALEHNLTKDSKSLNLSANYSDFLYTTFSNARGRCSITSGTMQRNGVKLTPQTMMHTLRDHTGSPHPSDSLIQVDVCMHGGFGPIKISQSTASMVVVLDPNAPIVFATGTSAPCTGVFKPFWVDAQLPNMGPAPTDQFDPATLFWSHEPLHRAVIQNHQDRLAEYSFDRDQLESQFIEQALNLSSAPAADRSAFSASCLDEARAAEIDWLKRVEQIPVKKSILRSLHNFAWNKFNRQANLV